MADVTIELKEKGDSVTVVAGYDQPEIVVQPPPFTSPIPPFSFIATLPLQLYSGPEDTLSVSRFAPVGLKVDVDLVQGVWWRVWHNGKEFWIKKTWL